MLKNWIILTVCAVLFCALWAKEGRPHSTYGHADHARGVPHGGAESLYPDHSGIKKYDVDGMKDHSYEWHTHTTKEHTHPHENTDGDGSPPADPIDSADDATDDTVRREPPSVAVEAPIIRAPALLPIRVTEYMLRDWSNRVSNLPQWIELYNPNQKPLDLTGYKFYYAKFNRSVRAYEVAKTPVTLSITIPANGAIILTTHKPVIRRGYPDPLINGISEDAVFVLNIDNVLKSGWRIVDPEGDVAHEVGMIFTEGSVGNPVLPAHVDQSRQSYNRLASEVPAAPNFYGDHRDIGSPGFFTEVAPRAPSVVKRKSITMWGSLKIEGK